MLLKRIFEWWMTKVVVNNSSSYNSSSSSKAIWTTVLRVIWLHQTLNNTSISNIMDFQHTMPSNKFSPLNNNNPWIISIILCKCGSNRSNSNNKCTKILCKILWMLAKHHQITFSVSPYKEVRVWSLE